MTLTYDDPPLAGALAALKTLPADSLILYARYSPVTKGRVTFPDARLAQIVQAATVPIYSSASTPASAEASSAA